jgi:hypothetical protein
VRNGTHLISITIDTDHWLVFVVAACPKLLIWNRCKTCESSTSNEAKEEANLRAPLKHYEVDFCNGL